MYAKVFSQIFDSSIADDVDLRHFFMDLLVLADLNGVVDMTASAIAGRTRIPLEKVLTLLSELQSPDPQSRSKEEGGRRIVLIDDDRAWGWIIVNYADYRRLANEEQRREKTRLRVAKLRLKRNVTLGNAGNAMQKQKQMHKQIEDAVPQHTLPSVVVETCKPGAIMADPWEKPPELSTVDFLKSELEKSFSRPNTEHWGNDELHLLCDVAKRENAKSELAALTAWKDRTAKPPTSIRRLLENWQHHLDRSRNEKESERTINGRNMGLKPDHSKGF